MAPNEATQVLLIMATAWPQRELSKPERDMWLRDLAPKDFACTMEAIDACRGAYDWLPTYHQFGQAYHGVRQRKEALMASRALAAAPPAGTEDDGERARQHIAGVGRPADRPATMAYSRVWKNHLRPAKDAIGRDRALDRRNA